MASHETALADAERRLADAAGRETLPWLIESSVASVSPYKPPVDLGPLIKPSTSESWELDEEAQLLDGIFNGIVVVSMCLCFFSLSSSMSANIFD